MTTTSKYRSRCCNECGGEHTPRRADERFCSTACRKTFDNRRMVRGAELYDLVMAWRFQRKEGDKLDLRGMIGRAASAYRDADKAYRGGRKSWNLSKAIERIPLAYGSDGDKR